MVRDDGDLEADEVLKEIMESELNASPNQAEYLLEEGAEVGYQDGEAYVDFEGDSYTDARDAFAQNVMTDGGYVKEEQEDEEFSNLLTGGSWVEER